MKWFWENNKAFAITLALTVVLIVSMFLPLHLPGKSSDYAMDGTNAVLRYEIFGCGSLIRTIEKGGEKIYEKAGLSPPASGVYEFQFVNDSDEPEKHIDSAEFYTGGIAEKYPYFVKLEVVGVDEGAPECCDPKPAYNETVPLVRVTGWEPATYSPYLFFTARHYITILALMLLAILNICLLVVCIIRYVRNKRKTLP